MISVSVVQLLLVEDDAGDASLVTEELTATGVPHRLSVVRDGSEALPFLRRAGRYASAPRPDLILLDLALPGTSGFEVLADIKRDPELRRTPVIVLTNSAADEDALRAYDLHANCYITKPVDYAHLAVVIGAAAEFWANVAVLPPRAA